MTTHPPRHRRRRHLGIILLIAAVGLALAGCDSSSDSSGSTTTEPTPAAKPTIVAAACAGTLVRSSPGELQSKDLDETSGLVVSAKSPGTLWLNNDSGDTARVFAVSTRGALEGIYPLTGATALDWEDIAIGPGPKAGAPYLYVGDIGDNAQARPNVVVYRVAEPKVASDGGTHPLTDVAALTLTYPDGPHDAEALMVDPRSGDLFIVIKQLIGGPASVYRAPAGLESGSTTKLARVGRVDLPRGPLAFAVTAADISRDGRVIGIRTYGGVRLYARGEGQSVIAALATKPCLGPVPVELQGEALGIQPDERSYFTVSEGVNVPVHRFSLPGSDH